MFQNSAQNNSILEVTMSKNFPLGSIVRIDPNRNIHASGKQGMVVGFDPKGEDGRTILVWVGQEADHLIDYPHRLDASRATAVDPPNEADAPNDVRTYAHKESELTIEPRWNIETLANRHFGPSWHHARDFKDPNMPLSEKCQVASCPNPGQCRIVINIWGTVMPADTCKTHALRYNRKCIELFPWRQETPKKAAKAV